MEELKTYWEVAGIAHFVFLFKDGFKLPCISYDDLETAFLTPVPEVPKHLQKPYPVQVFKERTTRNSKRARDCEEDDKELDHEDQSRDQDDLSRDREDTASRTMSEEELEEDLPPARLGRYEADDDFSGLKTTIVEPVDEPQPHVLVSIITRLLKGYFGQSGKINENNWQHYLKRLFNLIWVEREGKTSPFVNQSFDDRGRPEQNELDFNDLSLRTKVQVVFTLCEYRLYNSDSSASISHINEDELRVEPLGKDSQGNVYWYFFGSRLYRENPEAGKRVEQRIQAMQRLKQYLAKEVVEDVNKFKGKKREKESSDKEEQESDQESQSSIPNKTKQEEEEERPPSSQRRSSRRSKPVDRLNGDVLVESSIKKKPTTSPTTITTSPATKKRKQDYFANMTPDPSTSCGVSVDHLSEAWCCICQTEQDWESLTESFARSKVPSEVDLYKILSQDFLPRIKEIIKQEELLRKQQLAKEHRDLILVGDSLIPRRASSRIEKKQKEKEEEDKKRAEEEKLMEEERRRLEIQRRREEALLDKEKRERERQERSRIREEMLLKKQLALEMEKFNLQHNKRNHFNGLCQDADHSQDSNDEDFNVNSEHVSLVTSNGWPFFEHKYCTQQWQPVVLLEKVPGHHFDLVSLPSKLGGVRSTPSSGKSTSCSPSSGRRPQQKYCGVNKNKKRKTNPNPNRKTPSQPPNSVQEKVPVQVQPQEDMSPEDLFYHSLSRVMHTVITNREAWPFREPVDGEVIPNYYEVVKEPMCLYVMRDRVQNREYKSLEEVEVDFKLLVNNSETFNGPKSGFTQMAYGLWKLFRKAVGQKMGQSLHEPDESKVFMFPPPLKWKKTVNDSGDTTQVNGPSTVNGLH